MKAESSKRGARAIRALHSAARYANKPLIDPVIDPVWNRLEAKKAHEEAERHCQVEENSVDRAPRYCHWVRLRTPCNGHEFRVCARNLTMPREGQMRRFKSAAHAQRFLSVHGLVQNLFRVGRHLLRATHDRLLRARRSICGMR